METVLKTFAIRLHISVEIKLGEARGMVRFMDGPVRVGPCLRGILIASIMEDFRYVFGGALEGVFMERVEQNEEIAAKCLNEKDFAKRSSSGYGALPLIFLPPGRGV